MVALRGLESSIARFTGVGAIRRGVGPCRADGGGAGLPKTSYEVRGIAIKKPVGDWSPAHRCGVLQIGTLPGGRGVIIGNKFWGNVPERLIERMKMIEDAMVSIQIDGMTTGAQDSYIFIFETESREQMTGVDLGKVRRQISDKRAYGRVAGHEQDVKDVDWLETQLLSILGAAEDIKWGWRVDQDYRPIIKGVANSFVHCIPGRDLVQLRVSLRSSLEKHLTEMLNNEITGDRYFVVE
jgi:hypothetical protein